MCSESRGPTDCVNGLCVCKRGFCSQGDQCTLDYNIVASVVPVDQAHPVFPGQHGNISAALAISGGGSRSLSLALGAFRALEDLNLMRYVGAISSVSGGSWASSIYMFANGTKAELLGLATNPADLTVGTLERDPPSLGRVATTPTSPILSKLVETHAELSGDIWLDTIAWAILEPFGLGNRTAFFVNGTEARDRIISENPHLAENQFVHQRTDRPKVVIFSGTLLAPAGYAADKDNIVPLQMSPDFTGSPVFRNVTYPSSEGNLGLSVGGGFVETYAFGGPAPAREVERLGQCVRMASPSIPFTLAHAIGISSAAFASDYSGEVGLDSLVPRVTYWPVSADHHEARVFQVGDGWILDNSGLLALLQRRVGRIVWLVQNGVPINHDVDFCTSSPRDHYTGLAPATLTALFGYGLDTPRTHYSKNQVFSSEECLPLLCALQTELLAGRSPVVAREHMVLPNSWWGIKGGWNVTVVYVYNDKAANFFTHLPEETQEHINQNEHLSAFPFFNSVNQNSDVTAYTNAQVNLLAASSEYAIRESADIFRDVLHAP